MAIGEIHNKFLYIIYGALVFFLLNCLPHVR